MTARTESEQAARDARMTAINACRRCDPNGWALDPDGRAADLARRCNHGTAVTPQPPLRDITEPLHEPATREHHTREQETR